MVETKYSLGLNWGGWKISGFATKTELVPVKEVINDDYGGNLLVPMCESKAVKLVNESIRKNPMFWSTFTAIAGQATLEYMGLETQARAVGSCGMIMTGVIAAMKITSNDLKAAAIGGVLGFGVWKAVDWWRQSPGPVNN